MIFSVWAPHAKSVDLLLDERRIPLAPAARGYWQADVPAHAGQNYKYSLDGAAGLPDPRSRWQPQGVHGASQVLGSLISETQMPDRSIFRAAPLSEAIIYELHVGTFTPEGTYAAALTKLEHLCELGVTHLELMPLASFPGQRGWGYDGVGLFAPFPAYGTPAELAAFVQACHSRGLAVLLDVVYNHLGPDGNYLGSFAPYFTDRYKTGWGAAINYDGPHSDEVRDFVVDNALMWLKDYEFDGLRLDAVHAIFSFEAVHLLEVLSKAVRALGEELGKPLVLIAESDLNDPRLVHPVSRGGFGLDAQWSDDFHHALHRYFTGERDGYYADFQGLPDVATALRDGYVYQGQHSVHRGRRHGRPPANVEPHQLVVSAQNHDQIGNRAQGERLSGLLDAQGLKAVAALTLLSPFVPLLFQGEEWGASTPFLYFTDHQDPELGRLVAEGRSKEFSAFRWQGAVPNPQELNTFERSKLDWSELSQPGHAELLEWYRRLIRLKKDQPAMPRESRADAVRPRVNFDAAAQWLSFVHNGVLLALNWNDRAQRVPMPGGEWKLVMRSDWGQAQRTGQAQQMDQTQQLDAMPPRTTFIYIGG
ncbi:MAG TPA: malto-oligosyltrehalose trehalohydrolase [Steroidobacteraceae bacterium]|nr:malto-oligosyltrehalose trehalohydrolase [Steroidobacteraceae bacterium]